MRNGNYRELIILLMGMPGSQSHSMNNVLMEYALANSITYSLYVFQMFFYIDTLAYLIFIINLFLILVFPILFRRKAAVIAVYSYSLSLGVGHYLTSLALEIPLSVVISTTLYVIALFAFGYVLSGISRFAGVIYYGVAIATGIFNMLHYMFPEYGFYYYVGIIAMLLLAVAWLFVAIKVFRSGLKHGVFNPRETV